MRKLTRAVVCCFKDGVWTLTKLEGLRHEAEVMKSKVVDKIKTAVGMGGTKPESDQSAWQTK